MSETAYGCLPDYNGNSIVNVLASLINGCGGLSPHAECAHLSSSSLSEYRHCTYLLVDGLGYHQLVHYLKNHPDSPFFGKNAYHVIDTVFPATTAAAVTTCSTGSMPREHGILSWNINLADLGTVATILLSATRTGLPLIPVGMDWRAYLSIPDYIASVPRHRRLLSYRHIPDSPFSRAVGRWDKRVSYRSLDGLFRSYRRAVRRRTPSLVYAYWPAYDSHCHKHGCFADKTVQHLEQIDACLARMTEETRKRNSLLCVLADHGLVDTPEANSINLYDIPGFYDCLAVMPSGDARQVACLVRPSKVAVFLDLVDTHLGHACSCLPGAQLMQDHAYGLGHAHPSFSNRVGDYVLLARPAYAFLSPPACEHAHVNNACHGGMSMEEIRIPLYVIH